MIFALGGGDCKTISPFAQAVAMLISGRSTADPVAPGGRGGRAAGLLPGDMKRRSIPISARSTMRCTTCCRRTGRAADASGEIRDCADRFMRGRTLSDACHLDEAQNTTAMQMKMFLTGSACSAEW